MKISQTMGYVVAKMQDGYHLKYARKPYRSCLCVPQGGHSRNVPNHVIRKLRQRGLIVHWPGSDVPTGFTYVLTEKGHRQ